ncbi:MAG: MFS transporter [Acidobacteria bacterium]|nr:MFS transporter [Acidobacteriota bacterium]
MNPWRSLKGLPAEAWILCTATLINRAGMMVLPFLVLYLTRSLGYSAGQAGLAVTVYGVGAFVTGPVAGKLCDRFGALRVMKASLIVSGLILFVFPYVTGYGSILATTFVWAVTNEAFRPSNLSLLTGLVAPERRKAAYALNRLAINLGTSIGPAAGGFLSTVSFKSIFYVDGATSILAGLFLMAAPWREGAAGEGEGATTRVRDAGSGLFADRTLVYFLLSMIPIMMVFFQFSAAMPLFVVRELGMSELLFGSFLTINTVIIVFLEVALNAAMANWPHGRALSLGALLVALGYGGFAIAHGYLGVTAGVVLWTFGEMILFPGSAAYMGEIAPPEKRGEYMGYYTMAFSVAYSIGPWLGSEIFDRYGSRSVWAGAFALGLVATAMLSRVRSAPARGA